MFAIFDSPGLIPVVCPVNTFILAVSNFVAKLLFVLLSKAFTSSVKATTFAFVLFKLVLVLFKAVFNVATSSLTKS